MDFAVQVPNRHAGVAMIDGDVDEVHEAIHALEETHRTDQLRLRRLKKQKLALKDKIARIEDQLTPDIIA